MKDLVIDVVSFFVWFGLIASTVVGYFWGQAANHEILGAIGGFIVGCFGAGLWFVLTSIHEKLATLAEVAVKNRADLKKADTAEVKLADAKPVEVNDASKWIES